MLLGYSKKADLCCSELLWAVLNALALACASFGSSRNYPGALLEQSWASLGPVLDHLGSILRHLGASMSQSGAQQHAHQGLPFNAILGRYYAGASLARLTWHDQ